MRSARTLAYQRKIRIRRRHRGEYRIVIRDVPAPMRGQAPDVAYQLTFPETLDFSDNLEETLLFFSRLHKLIHRVRPHSIRINHSALKKLSPAAALVLIAEIVRGVNELPGCKWRGNGAANQEVRDLLGNFGYWKYFKGIEWKEPRSGPRQYIQHRTDVRTIGRIAKELVQSFLPELQVAEESKKALYPAIIECMDNVMKHAYEISDKDKYHFNRWWLLGFRDSQTHEVSFCFYDHGLGIPKTIRVRLKDLFGPLSPTDSELIVKAVVEGHYSSTKDPTRGRGLPTLKRFIDAAKSGEMMIVSHKSRCIFSKSGNKEDNFQKRFDGTLIIWRLQN